MEQLRPDNYLELKDKFNNGCNKEDCYKCPAFAQGFKRCVFDQEKLWRKWADKRHENFEKFMEEEHDKNAKV